MTLLLHAGSAHAQCPDGTPPPCRAAVAPARQQAPAANSIAVLPFANRSPDTADVYLAEGMTEEVGNRLTQLGRLQVISRGVVAVQWRRSPDGLAAARALRVAWFVNGSVRHVSGQLLVNVELVRASSGEEVWASRFPRRDADVFAVQAEVAESVAAVVGGRLSPGERAAVSRRPTRNNEAYRLFVLGNWLYGRRTGPDVRRAVEAYTAAVSLDPGFVAARARLSLARLIQSASPAFRESLSSDSLRALGRAGARRALELDSLSSDAWLAMAYAWGLSRDFANAHAGYERAIRLDSLNAEAFYLYGELNSNGLGDDREGEPLLRHALALDPNLRQARRYLASLLRDAGRIGEAEAQSDSALADGPWGQGLRTRASVRFRRGDGAGALRDLAEAHRIEPLLSDDNRALYTILLGDSAPALGVLARLRAQADSGQVVYVALARFSMALGRSSDALAALERLRATPDSLEARCSPTAMCSVSLRTWRLLRDPIFAPLRGDPRFERLWEETRPRVPWLEGQGR